MKKTVVELFAGVGGFRIGLETKGDWEVVWSNQWEPNKNKQHASDCYKKHFETGVHTNEDISKIDTKEIPEHTLLVGGFPCQDYSVARTSAKGIQGKKGVLFWEIKRIVEDKKPSFVLLENVDRLLKSPSSQRGRDFGIMLAIFRDLGYNVEWRVINAAEYGFVQKRKRVFIYAYRNDTDYSKRLKGENHSDIIHNKGFFNKEFPIKQESSNKHLPLSINLDEDVIEVSDKFVFQFRNSGVMIEGEIYSEEVISVETEPKNLSTILEREVDEQYYITKDIEKWEYLKAHKTIERISKTGHKYNYSEGQMAFPDKLDSPARTILTSEGSKNRTSHIIKDPITDRYRILTPIECERINGFPDDWTSTGMPNRFRYFCMGNALVVGIVERLGKTLSDIVDEEGI